MIVQMPHVQLRGDGDMEGAQLLPWMSLHHGRVAALDICAETREVGNAYRTAHAHARHSVLLS
jgi:hypothetical protein